MRVAVVAGSEVVRLGFVQLLGQLAGVEASTVFEAEEFTAPAPADALQLVILSCDTLILWCAGGSELGGGAWAARLAEVAAKNAIRVLVLLPAAEVRWAAPWNGVLDQDSLTARTLGEALAGGLGYDPRTQWWPGPGARAVPSPAWPHTGRTGALTLLTPREQQVLGLLVAGLTNREIGQKLALSEHGAKRLVASLLSKMNCVNRTRAVAVALREGLVSAEAW